MSLEDHRNPNGTYDGAGVLSELTGLGRDEVLAIAEQVRANHARLEGCPWHEFEALVTAPPGDGRYRCRHCRGEVDAVAYRWHQKGRRPMPVGEPQPALKHGEKCLACGEHHSGRAGLPCPKMAATAGGAP